MADRRETVMPEGHEGTSREDGVDGGHAAAESAGEAEDREETVTDDVLRLNLDLIPAPFRADAVKALNAGDVGGFLLGARGGARLTMSSTTFTRSRREASTRKPY